MVHLSGDEYSHPGWEGPDPTHNIFGFGFKILGEKYHLLPFFVGETFEDNIIVENNRVNPTMTIWTKMTQKSHEQTLKKKHCSKNISEKWR